MLLEIKISNFRSIKDEVVFSMVAEKSKSKEFNIFSTLLPKKDDIRLLKVASIFGPNASGKSNVFRAIYNLIGFLGNPPKIDEKIKWYDPFIMSSNTQNEPSKLGISFIGPENIKYIYSVNYDELEVLNETLLYFPEGVKRTCFNRQAVRTKSNIQHTVILGNDFKKRKVGVFKNQLLLSRYGEDEPHELFSQIYIYLRSIAIVNATDNFNLQTRLKSKVEKLAVENLSIRQRLNELIHKSDFKIDELEISLLDKPEVKFPDEWPKQLKNKFLERDFISIQTIHSYKDEFGNKRIIKLDFKEASKGTLNTFILGGIFLDILDQGAIVFVDELENSLHPFLSRMLVELFQNEVTNPRNAQLVFTSHDTNLMDKHLLRKDQVWFTDKDDRGVTDLYSIQDFDGVREDTPFEKWYLAGKFNALPRLPSVHNIFTNEQVN